MRKRCLLTTWCALSLFGCAQDGASDSKGAATTELVSSSGGSASHPSTGTGSSLQIGEAGSGSGNSAALITAEQTQDGLLGITSAQANAILTDPATSCAGWAEEPESAASVLEFIIDVSGSMNSTTAATAGATKWAVTQKSLHNAIDALPSALPVGLTFFPNMRLSAAYTARPVTACVNSSNDVAIAALSDTQRTLLTSTVDGMRVNTNGATPTHDAYNVALANIRTNTSPGQKYLVLITDGQPTQSLGCIGSGMTSSPEPTQPVIDAIAQAYTNDQVKTFVVGSPGSEKNVSTNADSRDWLSAAARAGGTDTPGCSDQGPQYCHFDLSTASDFGKALSDALGTIAKTVISCDYRVPSAGAGKEIDTSRVNMIYDNGAGSYSLVLPSGTSTCQKGWGFTDASLSKLSVCNETCALLQSNPKARVTLVFGCTQNQIQTPLI